MAPHDVACNVRQALGGGGSRGEVTREGVGTRGRAVQVDRRVNRAWFQRYDSVFNVHRAQWQSHGEHEEAPAPFQAD